ncbi:MAG: mannose-1-phosphate guanylyltransferase/mannose-6-phosphate isomerase [Magnetovibrio sp.]|nr:mannose-1-phosphate guanylyltransferase/mannose-6-phosphate isomerase [Magnetovibrio sp.]
MSATPTPLPIVPVILSGGAGTRLWPLSRGLRPKQFLALGGADSMFAETAARVSGGPFAQPMVICNEDHRFMVAEELRRLALDWSDIVLEPCARNTAPAIAVAALRLLETDADAIMAVLPSDHVIGAPDSLREAFAVAAEAAGDGRLVTFGIPPARPETGYGYIQRGDPLAGRDGAFGVRRFVEKPDPATARDYLAAGDYLWNSGMFVFRAEAFLAEMTRFHPETVANCRAALVAAESDLDFLRLDEAAFAEARSISIDYAVMEKTDKAAVVPLDAGWSDLGSWAAMWELGESDAADNVLAGDALAIDARGNYIRSEKPLVAAVGVEGLAIVATDDAVLVVPKERAQDVRLVVDALAESGREEVVSHTRVYRPWGYYQNLDGGDGFLVKQIVVNAGAKLSLQHHNHRAEHWVVVEGEATVTNGDDTFVLGANQSTYIPLGAKHRLENRTDAPLRLIEVQSGDYIGEDDIVRLEDTYGRS